MAESLLTVHLFADDLPADASWRLLAWCRSRGADEFTLDAVESGTGAAASFGAFDAIAEPHRRATATRRRLSAVTARDLVRPTELWALNDATERLLREVLPTGLFHYDVGSDGWFEDPTVYRRGELMLGIITHEGEGVLRLSDAERVELDRLGMVYRMGGKWVGY